jgi:pyrroloquinoline quinone (PQQ) biosynthesis protein C
MRQPTVEIYLCAFHVGKWEIDESVEEAYHRALDVSAAQFHRIWRDDCGALQEKHADVVHRMYEAAGINLKTATENEKASLRMRLIDEARKGGMRFPA